MVHQRKGAPWGIWPVGQAVKTPASHAGNAGSIPARVTNFPHRLISPHLTQTSGALRLLIIQPVIMTLRIHLFPFRTQKLSSASRTGHHFPFFPTNLTPYSNIRSLVAFDHTAGDYDAEDPPVPIPNTEVKLSRAENTWRVAAWKHRSSPASLYSSIAQSVEHATVNRTVVGSSPTWGATIFLPNG